MRVRIPSTSRYVYPDVTILCGPASLEGERDILLNPSTIIEVLSPSTAAFDRGDKFLAYRSIPGIVEVVFVSQHERRVECYTHQADDSWVLREFRGDSAAVLSFTPAPLGLELIYAGVEVAGGPRPPMATRPTNATVSVGCCRGHRRRPSRRSRS
jgi:hypothetical protein